MLKKFKMVINKRFVLPFTVILSILFLGWGSVGHSIISLNTKLTLLPAVSFFNGWPEFLSLHASDADNSRNYDFIISNPPFYKKNEEVYDEGGEAGVRSASMIRRQEV